MFLKILFNLSNVCKFFTSTNPKCFIFWNFCRLSFIQHCESSKHSSPKVKLNDDNNNVINCDNRSVSETDYSSNNSSLSSSDKENDSRPSSSLHGNIIKSENHKNVIGDGFTYRTMNGRVIKSVIPPGKGIKVEYKVSFMSKCIMKRQKFCVA